VSVELLLAAALVSGTPILLAALGELLSERAGVLNLGVEGTMLIGAVAGFAAANLAGSAWIGVLGALLAGALFGLAFAMLVVSLRLNQIVTGLAGAVEIAASTGRLQTGLSPGYGFMAILVAWLAAGNPIGILVASVLYAGLQNGGFALQVAGIPPAITVVLQAVLVLAALAVVGLGRYRIKLVGPMGARA
jgi:ABC-type uncharacterized transport system permease subunit